MNKLFIELFIKRNPMPVAVAAALRKIVIGEVDMRTYSRTGDFRLELHAALASYREFERDHARRRHDDAVRDIEFELMETHDVSAGPARAIWSCRGTRVPAYGVERLIIEIGHQNGDSISRTAARAIRESIQHRAIQKA